MTSVSDRLIAAYRGAIYEIDVGPGETIRARIDCRDPAIDAVLARAGARDAAFLTAYNPASFPLCEAENKAAHESLHHEIRARGLTYLPARGADPAGAWLPEPGFFALGIARGDAT